jgi:hypothetical protein
MMFWRVMRCAHGSIPPKPTIDIAKKPRRSSIRPGKALRAGIGGMRVCDMGKH